MKKSGLFILSFLFSVLFVSGSFAQDKLLDLLKDELNKEFTELKKGEYPPYHMNLRVTDQYATFIKTSFGALVSCESGRYRALVPQVRIGSVEFDNFKNSDMGCMMSRFAPPTYATLPVDETANEDAIRQAIWGETTTRYDFAIKRLQDAIAEKTVNVAAEDKAPCFSPTPVEKYYEPVLPTEKVRIDEAKWTERMKEISAVFNQNKHILKGTANLTVKVIRTYFLDTDGTEVVQNLTYARILVQGETKAEDGMELPLSLSYFAFTPNQLPSNEQIIKDANEMVKTLLALREAPVVQPFTGPALLSGAASGVFFHEIFGHRVEGQKMKSEQDGQTFKSMVGQYVLPKELQVFDDPSLEQYIGLDLNGHYKYDDQGVKAQRVDVVVDGKLNDFLMTRTPIDNHPKSNGHGRCAVAYDPVSRQANLIVETKNHKTDAELRQMLIAEAKKQGKDCGYFFKEVTGGFTMTGRGNANSFNVTPLEVYKIYVDGRPDELVRGVDLIGTPLSMFSNIIHAGGTAEIFTGTCGAASGYVPVTAISPTILVNKVEMQRKDKSQDLPPILERP